MSDQPFAAPTPEPRWPRNVPDIVWATIVSGILILIAGAFGYVFRKPWLFASLGPTAFLIAETPNARGSAFYNTIVGHLAGIASGVFAAWVCGAISAPTIAAAGYPVQERMWAATLAVALNVFVGILLRASHPPAAATTLLFALGIVDPNPNGVVSVIVGVSIMAVFGEVARAARLGRKPSFKDFLPS